MTFQVETGSGDAGANAYVSVAYFRTHHIDRGNSAHTDFTDTDTMAGIIRASEYVDKRFGIRFVGPPETFLVESTCIAWWLGTSYNPGLFP